jgi:glutamate 5-kinase
MKQSSAALKHLPDALQNAARITLKVGSSLIIDHASMRVNHTAFRGIAEDVAALMTAGKAVMIVTSGAAGLGRAHSGLKGGRLTLAQKQAAAAAGQPILMRAWDDVLAALNLKSAQILLTREDTEIRRRWLNARETVKTLLDLKAVPIVNENDTVANEEIRYGDNDRLAARASQLMRADLLILLSDIDGLYSADPRKDKAAQHIGVVEHVTPEIEAMAGGANLESGVGTGGMATKLMAAKIAGAAGTATLIADGRITHPLMALSSARFTLIKPQASAKAAYKAWIASSVAPSGILVLDAGAVEALKSGKSLLPSGIRATKGEMARGDTVSLCDDSGREIARGIIDYDVADIAKIMGHSSRDIETLLGYSHGDTVIHRDDLVMV